MRKLIFLFFGLFFSLMTVAQPTGTIDKKSKEFYFIAKPNTDYKIFGYQFANLGTQKMICFSSYTFDVRGNPLKCPLGAYFDTSYMKEGDKIIYLGMVGKFGKMNYISGSGKKTLFYMPSTSFHIH